MEFVLYFRNKMGELRYFNKDSSKGGWYDCDSIGSAKKFPTRWEALRKREMLNKITKQMGWYGTYRVKEVK